MIYDVAILGGGLAGCAAAIHLANSGAKVLLLEQKRYPIYKLCGEFLSSETAGAFARLGVGDAVITAGAAPIHRVLMTGCRERSFACELPLPALGLSRYRLDPILWRAAGEAGVECHDLTTVRAVQGNLADGFCVATDIQTFHARVLLAAYGKRARLDGALADQRPVCPSPYVAFKAHFRGVDMAGAIEMHAFPGGYCGLSAIEDGLVNLCWITHQQALAASGGHVRDMVNTALSANPFLARRLENLTPVTKYSGISQIHVGAKEAFDGDICCIGDAAGMISPLCGDGMAMALRSAEIAAPLVISFLEGSLDSVSLRRVYTLAWRREFAVRMALGRVAHAGALSPPLAQACLIGLRLAPGLGRWLIAKTRG